ncbi:MAG TPA: hypothetical protein P5530_01535 [Candidatus Diapherotrites archaeon]|nr:hypothetical protein [Candidatus Diapherotrites archaeon]
MGLKEFYYKLEDKYFAMLDRLEEKGINLYKLVDPLEKNGIPTFPLFIIFNLAIIALIIFLLLPVFGITGGPHGTAVQFLDETNNPIANTILKVKLNGQSKTLETDTEGFFYFKDLSKDSTYILKLADTKYLFSDREEYTIDPTKKSQVVHLKEGAFSTTKTILFKTQSGEAIISELNVEFSCLGTDYEKTVIVKGGSHTLDDIPTDCGSLDVTVKNRSDYEINIPATGTSGEIIFSSSVNYATLSVTIKDKDKGIVLPDMLVSIYDLTGIMIDSGPTNANGIFSTELVQVSKNYKILVSDPKNIYAGINDLDYINNVQTPVTITTGINLKTLEVKKDVVGFIKVRVKSDSGLYLEGVSVKLSKGSSTIDLKTTDSTGHVEFGVKENVTYVLSFDKEGYFVYTNRNATVSESTTEVTLRSMNAETKTSLLISVTDTELNPLEYATVKIWDALNNTVVKIVTTDVTGRVIVSNLSADSTYFAEAIVGPFTGKTNNFVVEEREETSVPILVSIGYGTYNLTILNSDGSPNSNAIVKAYDANTNKEMTEKQTTTNETGLAILPIRADKEVYFAIITDGNPIITKRYSVEAENMTSDTIVIPSFASSSASIVFVGYFSDKGEQLPAVSAGQSATARFLLNVNRKYSKVLAHIRTGEGETCGNRTYSVTEDSIYIKKIKYAGNKMYGSVDYTPCGGETRDTSSIVRKDAKWFNVILDNPIEGSYIIDADIVVTDNAITDQSIFYRAEYQQGSATLRFPRDDVLGTSLSSSTRQALYAYANKKIISVGDSSSCENGICYAFTIKDKSTGAEKKVMDKFTAKEGTDYQLNFRLSFERPATDAILVVLPTGQTIVLNEYNITSGGSLPINDTDFSNIGLGNINANGTVNGSIDLSVINDITDELTFNIYANNDIILSKTIHFDLKPSKKMIVDVVPKTMVPFVPNVVTIGVTDESGAKVTDAIVFIRINGKTVANGKTDKDGTYSVMLPSTDIKDEVEFTVKKQNYSTVTIKQIVSENLIESIPEKLDIQLDISKGYSQDSDLVLVNNSILPLTIIGMETNIRSDYISLKSDAQGTILEPTIHQQINVSTRLTEKGIDLMTQKVIEGDLLVKVSEATLAKVWIIKVPIKVRITFGNSVDNVECLEINPQETTIRVENTNDIEYNIKIKNNCTVDDEPVNVGRIYAESDYKNTKKLGDYFVVVSGKEHKLSLDEKVEVANRIAAEETATIKLIFRPNKSAKSGLSNPIITFSSNRPNVNGVDVIASQHLPNIILNNYVSCIETPSSLITIPYCMGYGYSLFAGGTNTMNFNPYLMGQYNYQYAGVAPQSINQSWLSGSTYPSNMLGYQSVLGTGVPYTDYRENTPQGYPNSFGFSSHGMFGCEKAQIQIRNNCSEDLSLQFSNLGGVIITNPENSEMTLKKGASGMLGVQGSQVLGQYKISVNAKPDDDAIEDYTYVKDIVVSVNRPVSILPENCISVVPTEFDFSGIDTVERKLTVINSCYDMGYALSGLSVLNVDDLFVGDVQYFYIGDVNKDLKPKKTYRYVDGKTTEIMTIKIRRNPEITEKTFRLDSADNNSVAKKLTALRKDYYDVGKAINLTALLGITYSNPRLGKDEMEAEITLVDKLQWLSYIDSFIDTSSALEGQTTSSTTPSDTTPGTQATSLTDYFVGSDTLNPGECYDPKGFRKYGFTGEENFKKFGFNRLLFTYNETDITHNICDYGRVYCDQDQLRIAISKKADLYSSHRTYLLDGVYFLLEGNKIAENPYLLDENPLDKDAIEGIVASQSFNNRDPNSILQALKAVIGRVPADLRKFTILEAKIGAKTTSEPTPANLSSEKIKEYMTILGDNDFAKNVKQDGDVYQITVDSFLRSETKLEAKINNASTTQQEQAIIAEFLNQYLNTMRLYYGDTISPFIINAKTYGPLNSGTTKTIFSAVQFMSGAWTLTLDPASSVTEIATPGTYSVALKSTANNKQLTYTVQKVNSNLLDYYNNNAGYKANTFFTNPTNAYYFHYFGVPFKIAKTGLSKTTQIIDNYNNGWDVVQDGIILKVPKDNVMISFKDIRPLQVLSSGAYKIEYIANGKYSSKDTSELKNTLFIFQKINESTKGADYQLKTSSNLDMRFNIVPTTLSATKNFTHVYGVLKDITSSSNFTAEETSSVQTMVNGISSEKMCFNFNNGFYLWYNPLRTSFGDTTSVTTSESITSTSNATAIAIAIATASVGQGSPEDSETTETGPTQLTISSGKVQVNASVPMMGDIGGTVNVASGNIKLDMSDKKLSGTVNLTSGDLSGEVAISNAKVVINGNTAQLDFFGKARGVPIKASGTLNVSGNQGGVDGTYNIVSGQVALTRTVLTFNNLNFTKIA